MSEALNYQYNVEKMYTYLRGYLVGAGLTQSITALQFAREKHKSQTRKNGVPYIVHPLSMACYAVALGLSDENVGKNAAETEFLLLPILKEAKEKWAELSDILFVLRTNIRSVNDILKLKYPVTYEKWMKEYND